MKKRGVKVKENKETPKTKTETNNTKIRVGATEKNEGRKGRCVYIKGNHDCRYVFKSKDGARSNLVMCYECSVHKDKSELLFKDCEGFYLC